MNEEKFLLLMLITIMLPIVIAILYFDIIIL
jgi:hypothetical protein